MNFNRFLDYYKDAKDLNIDDSKDSQKEKKEKKVHDDSHMVRLFFGMGKRDHIKPNSLIGKINDVTGTKDIEIGHIDLKENFSFVAVDGAQAQFIVDCFADPTKNRDGIRVEITTGEPKDKSDKKEKDKSDKIEKSDRKKSRDNFHEERRRHDREEEKHEKRSRKESRTKDKKDKKIKDKREKKVSRKKSREKERPEKKYGKRVRY